MFNVMDHHVSKNFIFLNHLCHLLHTLFQVRYCSFLNQIFILEQSEFMGFALDNFREVDTSFIVYKTPMRIFVVRL
jgi:hypothetical protein